MPANSKARVYCAKRRNGRVLAQEYLDALKERDPKAYLGFKAYFNRLEEVGQLWDTAKLKKLQGDSGIWEFKKDRYRILAFPRGNEWYLTNGFDKQGNKTPPKEIERAVRIKREMEEQYGWRNQGR